MSMTQTLAMSAGNTVIFPLVPATGPFADMPLTGAARVQVMGTFTGSAIFEETLDNANWFPSQFAFADAFPVGGVPVVTGIGGTFTVKTPGSVSLRLRCNVAGSGTAIVLVTVFDGNQIGLSPFQNAATFTGQINFPSSSTANQTSVAASVANLASIQLIGNNSARFGMSIVNDAPNGGTLTISSSGAASNAQTTGGNKSEILGPGAIFTPPINFLGAVFGQWDTADANTFARITEYI